MRVRYADLTAPPAPAAVTGAADGRIVRVQWPAVEAPDLAGYELRRLAGDGGMQVLTSTPTSALEFVDNDVPDGRWTYLVTAVDSAQNRSAAVRDEAQVFGLRVTSAATPTLAAALDINGQSDLSGELQVVRTPAFETPLAVARTDETGNYLLSAVPLALGNNLLRHCACSAPTATSAWQARCNWTAPPGRLRRRDYSGRHRNNRRLELDRATRAQSGRLHQLRDRGELLPPAAALAQPVTRHRRLLRSRTHPGWR